MKLIKEYLLIFGNFIKKNWLLLILFLAFVLVTYFFKLPNCPFKLLIGYPCPACGLTRATFALFRFDFVAAFNYNPLIFILPIIGWIIIFKSRPLIEKIYKSKVFWIVVGLLVIGVFILRFIFVYPNEPMEYNENNLINLILRSFN